MVIDCSSGMQEIIMQAYKEGILERKPVFPKVSEILMSSEIFMGAIENKSICHMGQPSLTNSVTNCAKRLIGTNGGYGFKTINESIDVCLLESAVFAHWLCKSARPKAKTRIVY